MSQEEWNAQQNTQQDMQQNANYVDPITAADGGKPAKKNKSTGSVIGSTIVAVVIGYLFGAVGGLICYGGFWAVYAIAKTKLPVPARVVLCVLTALVFLFLLFLLIILVAASVNR